VETISQRMLQALIAASGLPATFMLQPSKSQAEWTEEGLHLMWELAAETGDLFGSKFTLEHTVRIDARDAAQHRVNKEFAEKYHELKERLAALAHCATMADFEAYVDCSLCDTSNAGELCVVCQENISIGKTIAQLRGCRHTFHLDCLQNWLLGCSCECPVCKAPVRSGEAYQQEVPSIRHQVVPPPNPDIDDDDEEDDEAEALSQAQACPSQTSGKPKCDQL